MPLRTKLLMLVDDSWHPMSQSLEIGLEVRDVSLLQGSPGIL